MGQTPSSNATTRPIFQSLEPRLLLSVSAVPEMPDLVDAFDTGASQSDDITRLDNSDPSSALTFSVSGAVAGATVTVYADSTAIGSVVASDATALVTTDGTYDLIDGAHAITARQVEPGKTESDPSDALGVTVDATALPTQPWDLDASFDGDGKLTTAFGRDTDSASARAMALQSDGKIVVAGTADADFALARYNADGSLDASFDGDGKVTTDIGGADDAYAFAIQADGKIIVAGANQPGNFHDFALVRYNADGSLDTSFGGDGIVTTDFEAGEDHGYAMAIQSDGKILVAGEAFTVAGPTYITSLDFALARYNADGSLDTSFGGDGMVTTAFGDSNDRAIAMAIQPDGRIVLAGSARVDGQRDFALARYNTDGSLDASFGGDGTLTTAIGAYDDVANALAIQADGKIVVAGPTHTTYSALDPDPDFALVRYNIDGSLDASFDGDGKLTTTIGTGDSYANAMVIQSDGKIVAAGSARVGASYDFALVRYNSDGSLDSSFDGDGKLTADIAGYSDGAGAVAIQPDGKIVAAGSTTYPSGVRDFAVARFGHSWIDLQATSDTGVSDTDNITNDSTPTFDISVDTPYFRVYRNGALISGAFESGSSYTTDIQLDGQWEYTATSVDAAGNESATSEPLVVTIDTIAPAPPQAPDLQAASDFGVSDTDNLTADNTPTFDVTGGSPYFRVYRDAALASGAFESGPSCTVTIQPDGVWDYTATAADAAGNESAASSALTVTISTLSLPTPGPLDLQAASDSGVSDTDNITNDNTPTFDVSVATPYFRVYRDGTLISGAETGSTYAAPVQPDGTWAYTVTAVDEAENESAASLALGVTIDTVAPPVAPWAFDPNFDGDGKVTTTFGSDQHGATDMAIRSDGKIVAGGYAMIDGNYDFALARYHADGSLDTSLDGDGILTTEFGPANDFANALAIQADGKMVLAGWTDNGSDADFALARYNTDGSLDTTFDGDGKLTTDIATGDEYAFAMAIQPDGKIVVGGYVDVGGFVWDFALARYNPDGSLDTSFDGDGKVITDFEGGTDRAYAVAIQPDGKIVVAGRTSGGVALARYNPDGSLDSGFDGDGKVTTRIGAGDERAEAIAIQPDGKIVVAGYTSLISDEDVALARYNADGSLDTAFSETGKVITVVRGGDDSARAVTTDSDGKIVVTGYTELDGDYHLSLLRYLSNGDLDSGFGDDGTITTNFTWGPDAGYAVAIRPDGRIVVAGCANDVGFALVQCSDSGLDLQAASDTGASGADNITGDDTPTFDVLTEASYFRFYRDGSLVSGLYESGSTYTTASQPEGTFAYSVSLADAAGNASPLSSPLNVTFIYGQLTGQVFGDLNGNGVLDGVEVGIDGWTIELVDPATAGVITTTTAASVDLNEDGWIDPVTERGRYAFRGVVQGDYEVRQVVPTGWEQTAPMGALERTFAAGTDINGDFVIVEFDPSDGAILNSFAGPQAIVSAPFQGLAVGPDSLFYVDTGDTVTPVLWELDLDTGAEIDSDVLGYSDMYFMRGMAYLDGLLYIHYKRFFIAVWDPATDTLVAELNTTTTATGNLAAAPDLGVLFDTTLAGDIVTIDPATGAILNTFSPGLGALEGGLAYAKGELLAVDDAFGEVIHRIDPLTGTPLGSFTLDVMMNVVGLAGDMPNPAMPISHSVTLGPDEIATDLDFGNLAPATPGDFNGDGLVEDLDIDLLLANLGDAAYDLDGDGDADTDDVDFLVRDILNTEYGDANLDGYVDATDLAIFKVGLGWGAGTWAQGNLNGDAFIDATDLAIFKATFGFARPAEPAPPVGGSAPGALTLSTTNYNSLPPAPSDTQPAAEAILPVDDGGETPDAGGRADIAATPAAGLAVRLPDEAPISNPARSRRGPSRPLGSKAAPASLSGLSGKLGQPASPAAGRFTGETPLTAWLGEDEFALRQKPSPQPAGDNLADTPLGHSNGRLGRMPLDILSSLRAHLTLPLPA